MTGIHPPQHEPADPAGRLLALIGARTAARDFNVPFSEREGELCHSPNNLRRRCLQRSELPAEKIRMAIIYSGCLTILFLVASIVPTSGHSRQQAPVEEGSALSFARSAAINALTFRQGDRAGFVRAHATFTDDAWTQFVKDMQGWLDHDGAPTFSSTFVPSSEARVVDEQNDITHVRVPGTLTQSQNQSRTTYRAAVDVWAAGRPLRVQRLTQTTCVGASKACS
jgi:hypothetical protein